MNIDATVIMLEWWKSFFCFLPQVYRHFSLLSRCTKGQIAFSDWSLLMQPFRSLDSFYTLICYIVAGLSIHASLGILPSWPQTRKYSGHWTGHGQNCWLWPGQGNQVLTTLHRLRFNTMVNCPLIFFWTSIYIALEVQFSAIL